MIRIYLALFFLWLVQNFSYAQFCSTPTTNITITPSGVVQQTATYNSGFRAFNFNATAGCTYTFSTCGLSTIDTKLRLYDAALSTVGSADNGCSNGIQAEIDQLIEQYKRKKTDLTFFVTGGDAQFFDFGGKNDIWSVYHFAYQI